MRELSLHITDIVQNSIVAGAKLVTVEISEDTEKNIFEIVIGDNGKGMSEELVKKVSDPFTTSRTTRKVGLGIPLFKNAAEMSGGFLKIDSIVGKGTTIKANFIPFLNKYDTFNSSSSVFNLATSFDTPGIKPNVDKSAKIEKVVKKRNSIC